MTPRSTLGKPLLPRQLFTSGLEIPKAAHIPHAMSQCMKMSCKIASCITTISLTGHYSLRDGMGVFPLTSVCFNKQL